MPRQCHSIDSDLREYLLSAGRIALVCGLFLIPFRSVDASTDAARYQHELPGQLVWWAPGEQSVTSWGDFRDGLEGSLPVEPGWIAAQNSLPKPGPAEPSAIGSDLHPSLVELRVRLQV